MDEPLSQDDLVGALRTAAPHGGIATPEFIAAVLVDGDDDLAAWAIGQALEEQPRAIVFDDVVRRAMEIVGSGWETGRWLISDEHLATASLTRALAQVRPSVGDDARLGPVAVLAAPEGEQHVSGLACLAQILEEHGWRAENLGGNLPADDLQRFVAAREVDLVALSIVSTERIPELARTVEALRRGSEPGRQLPIIVGGRGVAGLEQQIPGVDHVGSLREAEEYVARLMDRLVPPADR